MPRTTTIAREIITIGSDPELAIVSSGNVLSACNVFKPTKNPTSINCDFGYDGHNATAEIRPKPASTPQEAVANIKKLLEKNKKKYPNAYKYNLMSTSHSLSLGGHIHFGNKIFKRSEKSIIDVVHNLDNLLAFPSMYLENYEDAIYRRNGSYGSFSDYRQQNWGFEYRTLSSFIASKALTSSIYFLSYAIADATINFKYHCKDIVRTDGFDQAFRNQFRDLLKPQLPYVFKEQKKLPKYKEEKEYRDNIDYFQEAVKKELPLFAEEIKKGWNIKFDISEYWKVEKLETLIEKITKLLIAIHLNKKKSFKAISKKFVFGSYKDLGCTEIAQRVNIAINNLIETDVIKSQEWKTLKIYGLKKDRPNEVWLGGVKKLKEKRRKQILGYLWEIASEFTHRTKIEGIKFAKDYPKYSIGFGRKLREENVLIAEVMVMIVILLINVELYKRTEKKNGKTKKLLVTKHKVVDTIRENLKDIKPFKVVKPILETNKLNGIKLPIIFDLNKTANQIFGDLENMNMNEKFDLAKECTKRFKKKPLTPILQTECISHCNNLNPSDTPLIKFCPVHLASMLKRIMENNLPNLGDLLYSDTFFCEGCAEQVGGDSFCHECQRCEDCCTSCGVCGEHHEGDHEDEENDDEEYDPPFIPSIEPEENIFNPVLAMRQSMRSASIPAQERPLSTSPTGTARVRSTTAGRSTR